MIAACVFIAAPAIAQDDTVPADPGSSNESTPEETPPTNEDTSPPEERTPPADEKSPSMVDELPSSLSEDSSKSQADENEKSVGVAAFTGDKVTLCHRTNSETNPYVQITVSVNSILKNKGHDSHNGPVFEPGLKDQKIKWGDIIPSFPYEDDGNPDTYPGQNVTGGDPNDPRGDLFLARDCQLEGEPPDEECPDASEDPECDEDEEECEEDCDEDEDGGDKDRKESALPDTGGQSPWILLTGGLLSVLGIAILSNGSMSLMQGSVAGRHVKL
jgi:hypothetical protein